MSRTIGEAEAYRDGLRKALEIVRNEPNFPGDPPPEIFKMSPPDAARAAGRAWQNVITKKLEEELNK